MNTAIIVAAGRGRRFGTGLPKQFAAILDKPLIVHTIERFELCKAIGGYIVVLPDEFIEEFEKLQSGQKFTKLIAAVAGGPTRAESVKAGFDRLQDGAEIVLIHDGARPLVSCDEIERIVDAAREYGAACLAAPMTDTIKSAADGFITGTVDRRGLYRALTPQAFRRDLLTDVYEGVVLDESITDECVLAERRGIDVRIVEGNPLNIKITHPEDIVLAETYLKEGI